MKSVTNFVLLHKCRLLSPFANPLRQFLQIGHFHSEDKLLPVDVVNGQDVILVEHDLVTLLQPMKSGFDERIVHGASKDTA